MENLVPTYAAGGALNAPAFHLGSTPISGRLILAPLSGYTDQPFRNLCREMGAALTYTGLLSASGIIYGSKRTDSMLRFADDLPPLVCQIFGSDEDLIVEAARRVVDLGGIAALDFNMGCAEPKVADGGSGAAWLRDPARIGRLFARLTRALPLPVTGKIRLGWDDASRNYLEVARVLEDNGAALVAVHGRTAEQAYRGAADWDAIAEVKRALSIPVLASGDVKTPADIDRLLAHTGCDGVLIGRAAIGHPWIFQRRAEAEVPLAERLAVMRRHLCAMLAFDGEYHGVQRFRKHLCQYFTGAGVSRKLRRALLLSNDAHELLALLDGVA